MSKKTRPQYDWDRIEREYRANQLSNRELAKKHGPTEAAIRDRAKRYGWVKDLAKQVHAKTQEKLLRSELRTSNAQDDAQIIEDAAARGAEIIQSHRKDINDGRNMCGLLMRELRSGTEHAPILSEIIGQTADDEDWSDRAKSAAMRAISLPQRAGVMRDLANSMKVLQQLERTAFNLDGKASDRDPLDELLDCVMDSSRGIDGYTDGQ